MTASFQYLTFSLDADGVATVLLDRPPANAVDRDMYIEIAELFGAPDAMGEVKAIVLGAQGRLFCAGNDLDEFATMTPDNVLCWEAAAGTGQQISLRRV